MRVSRGQVNAWPRVFHVQSCVSICRIVLHSGHVILVKVQSGGSPYFAMNSEYGVVLWCSHTGHWIVTDTGIWFTVASTA